MKNRLSITLLVCMMLVAHSLSAQEMVLKVGDKVQPFSAKSDNGDIWFSKDVIGKKNLVVYFYPAAMTGGCTKQACAYRDDKEALELLGAEVIAVSGDEVKNLQLFKEAHSLNFTLLSDADGTVSTIFGVPFSEGEKVIEREVNGILYKLPRQITSARWTFVINKDGKVIYKSTNVNAAEDSKAVIAALKDLK